MTISEQVVKAMPERIYAAKKTEGSNCVVSFDTPSLDYNVEYVRADLVPFLPVQVAVKKLEWGELRYTEDYSFAQDAETSIGRYIATDNGWFLQGQSGWKSEDDIEVAKSAAQADFEARILSALEPSAARELALEDRARLDAATAALISLTEAGIPTDVQELLIVGDPSRCIAPGSLSKAIATVLRTLSSPDHADAGKAWNATNPSGGDRHGE